MPTGGRGREGEGRNPNDKGRTSWYDIGNEGWGIGRDTQWMRTEGFGLFFFCRGGALGNVSLFIFSVVGLKCMSPVLVISYVLLFLLGEGC